MVSYSKTFLPTLRVYAHNGETATSIIFPNGPNQAEVFAHNMHQHQQVGLDGAGTNQQKKKKLCKRPLALTFNATTQRTMQTRANRVVVVRARAT